LPEKYSFAFKQVQLALDCHAGFMPLEAADGQIGGYNPVAGDFWGMGIAPQGLAYGAT